MEFVFIFAICFVEVSVINLLKIMKIVGTLRIDAFMEDKLFALLFSGEGMIVVRAY